MAKGSAFADGAFDLNPALMLLNDAVNRGEAEASAFANFLGGEKRLKDARNVFRWDAASGVGFADADETPDPRLGLAPDMGFVHFNDGDADGELAAARHGVERIDVEIQ